MELLSSSQTVTPVNDSTSAKAPTAYDLLQNLMLDTAPASPGPRATPPGQASPRTGLLFGGELGGSSIWTMTREESEKGTKRSAKGSAGNLANVKNLWSDTVSGTSTPNIPPPTAPWLAPAPGQHTPPRNPSHLSGSVVPVVSGQNIPRQGHNTLDEYHQYYEPQHTSYRAQRTQTYPYHPA